MTSKARLCQVEVALQGMVEVNPMEMMGNQVEEVVGQLVEVLLVVVKVHQQEVFLAGNKEILWENKLFHRKEVLGSRNSCLEV